MSDHAPKKCAHAACSCTVTEGKYCSQMCQDSHAYTGLTCDCKHPACTGAAL
jgi:hypothetical protein